MTTWPVPRALALWILLFCFNNTTPVESKESKANPKSTPDPGGGQSPSSPSDPVTQTQSEQLVVLDLKKKETCNEYEYVKDDAAKTQTYTARAGYKFNKIKNGNADVWNPTNNKYATKATLTTDAQGKTTVKVDTDDSTPTQSEPKKVDKPKNQLKGVMVAMDDEKTTDEFEFSRGDKTMTYTVKEGYGFNEVKWLRSAGHIMRADRNVWTTHNFSDYAHKVVVKDLGWLKYDLYVYQFHGGLQVYHRPAWGSEWSHTSTELLLDKSENIDKSEHPKQLTVLTLDKDKSTKENDTSQYQVDRQSRGVDNPVHDYTFKFKDGAKCVELRYRDQQVWNHDKDKHKDQFPTDVVFKSDNKVILISFKEWLLVYVYRHKALRLMFNGKPEPIELDINKKESTACYDYFANTYSKKAIFLSKNNNVFREVKIDKSGCCSKGLDLWSADDWTQYAYKVTRDDPSSDPNTFTVHLINGDTRTFKKSGRTCKKKWREIITLIVRGLPVSTFNKSEYRCKEETEHKPPYVNFKFDGDKKENDTSQYSLILFTSGNGPQEKTDSYRYEFKLDSTCIEVKIGENVLWKHESEDSQSDDDEPDHYPYIVFYDLRGIGSLRITFRDSSWVLYKFGSGSKWHKIDGNLESRGPCELDLKTSKKGKNFDFYKNDSTKSRLYLAKAKCWFNKVTQGDNLLFEAKDRNEYVLKVITIESEIELTLSDGTIKKLKQGTDGKFVESS